MLESILVCPTTKTNLINLSQSSCEFDGEEKYPVVQGIPVLISEENSLFRIEDILTKVPQTQDIKYADSRIAKNYIRKFILPKLPKLSSDRDLLPRYRRLAKEVEGGKVLMVGAGNKIDWYKTIFSKSEVITSDVHLQFGPDIVFDVHDIPIRDNTF